MSIVNSPLLTAKRFFKGKKAFSFIEAMVAIGILSVGIVFIFKAFFVCLDTYNHLTYRFYALNLLNNKIARAQVFMNAFNQIPLDLSRETRTLTIDRRPVIFESSMVIRELKDLNGIYQLDFNVSWEERNRTIGLSRSSYIANLELSRDNKS